MTCQVRAVRLAGQPAPGVAASHCLCQLDNYNPQLYFRDPGSSPSAFVPVSVPINASSLLAMPNSAPKLLSAHVQVLKLVIAIALLGIVGLNAAAIIAGPNQYWTYYRNKTTNYQFKCGPCQLFLSLSPSPTNTSCHIVHRPTQYMHHDLANIDPLCPVVLLCAFYSCISSRTCCQMLAKADASQLARGDDALHVHMCDSLSV